MSLESGSQYSEWKTNLCKRYSAKVHRRNPPKRAVIDMKRLKDCHDSIR